MFVINSDMSIYVTRGDIVFFDLTAQTQDGTAYSFREGDVLRIRIFKKKDCSAVAMVKDFGVEVDTDKVEIYLEGDETKFGGIINKPTDYWYEIELNPDTNPQTLVGYNDDGPAIFRLFPEGKAFTDGDIDHEDEILKGQLVVTIENIVEQTIQQQLIDVQVEEILREYIVNNPTIKGEDGEDGITPNIGANGNWWIGITDTGVAARGAAAQLRIDPTSYEWELSYDDGQTWQALGVKAKGEDGKDGEDGVTPVKGEDYFTDDDVSQMTQNVVQYMNSHPDEVNIGANSFIVVFTKVNDVWQADKTFAATKAAITKGDVVVCDFVSGTQQSRGQLIVHTDAVISFEVPFWSGVNTYFSLSADESVNVFESEEEELFPYTVSAVKSDNTVTVTAAYSDMTTSITTITLDDNGYPVGVTKDGKDCALSWGGFE